MNAFGYLLWTSWRNRIVGMAKRLRNPRYAIGLGVGVLYIWSFLFRPVARNGAGLSTMFLGPTTETLVTVLVAITLMGAWVFGADTTALAFTQAEVTMLFSAPLSRRQLIVYKLVRSQVGLVINALIWVFVLRRGGVVLPSPLRAIGLWVLFSTLSLHRLGAALVRSSWTEHRGAGVARHRVSVLVFVTVGVLVAAGLISNRALLGAAHGAGDFVTTLTQVLGTAPAWWGLYPFHLVVAPTFATSVAEWTRLFLPAVGVLLAHAWWVLRTDAAFEDAAIVASATRARRIEAMRDRRSMRAPSAPRTSAKPTALAAGGHPAVAILWKNMLCFRRTAQLRNFIGPVVMAVAGGTAVASGSAWSPQTVIAGDALALAAVLLIFGSRLIRNDLRHDMQHLPLIKSFPLRPGDIVLAEVASSALPMACIQLALIAAAYVVAYSEPSISMGRDVRTALLITAPFAVVSLNGALSTIQNAMAVLFPGWVRLGPTVSTGVEMLGQNLLATVASLIGLLLVLVVPVAIAWIVVIMLHETHAGAIAVVVVVSAIVLGAETYAAIEYLGRALSRAEPLQAT